MREALRDLEQKRDESLEAARNYQIQIDDRAGLVEQLEARVDRRNRSIEDLEKAVQEQTELYETQVQELEKQKAEVEELTARQEKLKETLRQSVTVLTSTKKKYDKERDKLSSTRAYMRQSGLLQRGFPRKRHLPAYHGRQERSAVHRIFPYGSLSGIHLRIRRTPALPAAGS